MGSKTDKKYILTGKNFRISVLSDRLFRIELNKFTDLSSQAVICRDFSKPNFEGAVNGHKATIVTDNVKLKYDNVLKALTITDIKTGKKLTDKGNLKGTIRTLDFRLGKVKLPKGIMAKGGVSVYDDSKNLLIENGEPKKREGGNDFYIFAYGNDYLGCLKDFFSLTGYPPLLPKYAFTNWWSRYYPYSEESYIALMQEFIDRKIPIGVATVDMDWHWVNEIPKEFKAKSPFQCGGWTGYSWNTNLFPDYRRFLKWLHDRGMAVTLNIHPRDGVRSYEDMYEEMAKANGIDPATKKTVEFDFTNPTFRKSYFDILHRPYEKDGVNFWWIDWQQGKKSKLKGLDPLWLLNHYHFLDSKENGDGLILSRFAGIGSHRYPLGFSGDCIIAWKSLKFQPYFTANATNVGYTWWSHDIGGHVLGKSDDELYLRWLQLGVFSPINRLHSSRGEFTGKEPWLYRRDVYEISKEFMRLRHAMLPYLYSANKETNINGVPLIEPIYYRHNDKKAYRRKNEYYFGGQLLVAPITSKIRRKFNRAGEKVYIPEGTWYDIFTGDKYVGGKTIKMWRKLDTIPVLAKEGAIIPKMEYVENELEFENLIVSVYVGNGSYTLYDEDGQMVFTQSLTDGYSLKLEGDLPKTKKMTIKFENIESANITLNDKKVCGNEIVFDGKACTIALSDIVYKKQPDYKKELNDIMQDYHILYLLRWKAFSKIKKADTFEKTLRAVKMAPIRRDVKSALLEKLLKY